MSNQQIVVSIPDQRLQLLEKSKVVMELLVSTAKNGPGELFGSECTPRGKHIVRAKIGEGCAIRSVFVGRRATGEIYSESLSEKFPDRDWILTRILWLSGCEAGKNRLGNVDTMRRFIYIHGSPDNEITGQPNSHGCVRVKNVDMLELFNRVHIYAPVLILD